MRSACTEMEDELRSSVVMPVETNDAYEGLLELIVDERVTEGVDRAVEVAQPIGDVVERRRYARAAAVGSLDRAVAAAAAEPDEQREDVPRRPHEVLVVGATASSRGRTRRG